MGTLHKVHAIFQSKISAIIAIWNEKRAWAVRMYVFKERTAYSFVKAGLMVIWVLLVSSRRTLDNRDNDSSTDKENRIKQTGSETFVYLL